VFFFCVGMNRISIVVFWSFRVRLIPCVRGRGLPSWSSMRVSFNVPVIVVVFCMFSPLVFGSVCAVVEEWTDFS